MSGDVGSLSLKLVANIVEYVEGLAKAEYETAKGVRQMVAHLDSMKRSAADLGHAIEGIALAAVSGFTLDRMAQEFDRTIGMAAKMRDLAAATGNTTEQLSQITGAAQAARVDSDALAAGLEKLTKGMNGTNTQGQQTIKALDKMGLSAKDAEGHLKPSAVMFEEIAAKMETYRNSGEKTALAQALLGKSGAAFIPVMQKLIETGGMYATVTTEQAARAEEFEVQVNQLRIAKENLVKEISFAVLPAAQAFISALIEAQKETGGLQGKVKDLTAQGVFQEWAENGAIALAWLLDKITAVGRGLTSLGASVLVVARANDVVAAIADPAMHGGLQGVRDSIAEFKQTWEFAREQWKITLNADLEAFETKVRAQIATAKSVAAMGPPSYLAPEKGVAPTVVPQTAAQIKNLANAMQFLGEVEARNQGVDKAFYDGMVKLDLVLQHHPELLDRVVDAYMTLYDAHMKLVNDPMQKSTEALEKSLAKQRAAIDDATHGLAEWYDAQHRQIEAINDTERAQLQNKYTTEALNVVSKQWEEIYKQMGDDVLPEVVVAIVNLMLKARELGGVLADDAALANARKLVTAIQDETAAAALDDVQRQKSIALRELDRTGIDKTSQAYLDLRDAIVKAIDVRNYDAELKELRNDLTDIVIAAFEGESGAVKRIINLLTREFEKLVLRPLIEPIMSSAAGWVLGLFGMAGSGGAAASGGGGVAGGAGSLMNFVSLSNFAKGFGNTATSVANWFTGAGQYGMYDRSLGTTNFWSAGNYGNMGTAGGIIGTAGVGYVAGSIIGPYLSRDEDAARNSGIGGAAGSVIGSYIATGTSIGGPWGAVIGAAVGIIVGALSDADGPAMRTAQVVAGRTMAQYTYGLESKLGTLGIARGSDKWFSDSEMGSTLTEWFKAIGDMDNAIAARLTTAQLAAAQVAVGGQDLSLNFGMEHTDVDPAAFGRIVQDRYSKALGAVDEEMGRLISSFTGTVGDLLALVDDLSSVAETLTKNGAQWQELIGQSFGVIDLEKFKKDGETYSQTLQRIGAVYTATNLVATVFGRTQAQVWGEVGLASEEARQALIDAAGGIDNLTGMLSSYYSHYYTEEERRQREFTQLQNTFERLGVTMPTSITGFRELMESILATKGASDPLFVALLAIEGIFYDVTTAADGTADAIDKNRDALDEWAKRIKSATDSITASIAQTARDIYTDPALMSPEQLHTFYAQEYGNEAQLAEFAKTPEDVQKWVDAARSTLTDWWKSLTTEEKQAQGQWFLQQLAGLNLLSQNAMSSLQGPLAPPSVSQVNSDAANTQAQAAKDQKDAAAINAAAASDQLTAASTPRRLIVDIPSLGVSAEVGV